MLLNNQVKQSPIIGLAGMGGGISSYVFLSADGTYEIARSLRFDSSSSAYLSRTPSAGNRKTWTWAGWVKRSVLSEGGANAKGLLSVHDGISDSDYLEFRFIDNRINLAGYSTVFRRTTPLYRDVSAWFHIVLAVDTTNSTADDRIKIYVNGEQVTDFNLANNPSPDADLAVNKAASHTIGSQGTAAYFDGYLADVWFIDGQALEPTSFGEFDATTGVWNPKRYTGAKSGNSFHLPFSDNTSTTTLGYDDSGNNNNWTLNNFSVAAGAGNDSLLDSPSNDTDTGTGIGGEITGNYATFNAVDKSTNITLSNGNLDVAATTSYANVRATLYLTSGKWYWELTCPTIISGTGAVTLGVASSSLDLTADLRQPGTYSYWNGGRMYAESTLLTSNSTYTGGDIIGFALDQDANTLSVYKNGVLQTGSSFSGLPTSVTPVAGFYGPEISGVLIANFGQRDFAYTAPTGFKALNTAALPTPAIEVPSDYVGISTWTGDGTNNRKITTTFSPDFVWAKFRNQGYSHGLYDTVRGDNKRLVSNSDGAEQTVALGMESDGFVVEGSSSYNDNNDLFVAWCWKAGGAPTTDNVAGAGNVPTAGSVKINGANSTAALAGSIPATRLSVNTTSGFSIVSFTGNGTSGATVGHSLGAAPDVYIIKNRSNSADWIVYTTAIDGSLDYFYFVASGTAKQNSGLSAPTSSVFSIGSSSNENTSSDNYIAYCWSEVEGYSKIGKYTGSGNSDGPFIYCGFKPKWVWFYQLAGTTGYWIAQDVERDPYNPSDSRLFTNSSAAEASSSGYNLDIVSNGFKIRNTHGDSNASSTDYFFMAFAESPFSTQARAR